MRSSLLAIVPLLLVTSACGANETQPAAATSSSSSSSATTSPPPASESQTSAAAPHVEIRLRLERRATDAATENFEAIVRETLTHPGWVGAGFAFTFAEDAPYLVVLGEGAEVDALCAPYRTRGRYSCQNGPVVALNAGRWRSATPHWTGDLASYRQMLVNHEVGHLLGQHHPTLQCPQPGAPAPVMAQQSTELGGCSPNPWPLQ